MTTTSAPATDYVEAIARLQHTHHSYGGGLSNHGPMAVEALVSMGVGEWITPFLDHYLPRLESAPPVDEASQPWDHWLRRELRSLVDNAGKHAGHGLLRTAHATRALDRAAGSGTVPAPLLRELAAGVGYWRAGREVVPGPSELTGSATPAAWVEQLPRLDPADRGTGLLTRTIARAVALPGFADAVAALGAGPRVEDTLDALALQAVEAYLVNDGIGAFALLHGVTSSTMARALVPHLDLEAARKLEASVAAFVAAATIGFDDGGASPPASVTPDSELATAAATTLDDHTIKFADACLGLAERTGSVRPLVALRRRIAETAPGSPVS